MLRKTLVGALVMALTPALAFAAPLTTMKARPTIARGIHHTVKLKKDTHLARKIKTEKIRLIQKHHAVKKMRVVTHLKHRTVTHKI